MKIGIDPRGGRGKKSKTVRKRMRFFEEGLKVNGDEFVTLKSKSPSIKSHPDLDLVVKWGNKRVEKVSKMAPNFMVMDYGFLGNRLDNLYIGYNNLNGLGEFPVIKGKGDKWKGDLKPWVTPKDSKRKLKILFLGQLIGDASVRGLGYGAYSPWGVTVANRMKAHGHEVVFRPHPIKRRARLYLRKVKLSKHKSLAAALDDCDLAVSYCSNSLVEAVIAGVPVIPLSRMAMSWDMRSSMYPDIAIRTPPREDWLDYVASAQWSKREIASGEAWKVLRNHL